MSDLSESCCSIGFHHFPPLHYTFVQDTIEFDRAWEPAQESNALILSVVSSLLRMLALSACICSMAVKCAIDALTFVAVFASTMSSMFT